MAHVLADRVLEASTSAGTGPFTLAGAVLGFRAFTAVCAVSDTVPYYIEGVDDVGRPTGEYEFGLGTYSAANQLTRTTVRGSSNGGLAVSFAAGTKLVGLGVPAPNSTATRLEWRTAIGALSSTMATRRALGRVTAGAGNVEELDGAQLATLQTSKLQPITATVNGVGGAPANGMLITINPTFLDFRSATLGSGAVNTRDIAAAITLSVPTGATLGMVNGVATRFAVIAIDNAGTPEVALVNLAGGLNLDETGLISTTAMSAAADSANVIYSTTARANVPYRLAGFLELTQAAAGVYVTPPSTIQGAGGMALQMWLMGFGRTWQNMTGVRAVDTPYVNTSGREIEITIVSSNNTGAANNSVSTITVGGLLVSGGSAFGTGNFAAPRATVPAGATYSYSNVGTLTINGIYEYR